MGELRFFNFRFTTWYRRYTIDPNSKIVQGATSGDGNDKKGQSKSKVDPAIFRMAEERDY